MCIAENLENFKDFTIQNVDGETFMFTDNESGIRIPMTQEEVRTIFTKIFSDNLLKPEDE